MISSECLGLLNKISSAVSYNNNHFVCSMKLEVWRLEAGCPTSDAVRSRNMSGLELLVAPDTAVPPSHYPGLGHLDAKSDYCQCVHLIKKGKETCTKHTPSDEAT